MVTRGAPLLVVPYEPTPHVFRPRVRYQNEFPIGGTDASVAIADEVPEARQISEAPLPTGSWLTRPRTTS